METDRAMAFVKLFRGIVLNQIDGLTDEQMLAVPEKLGNNILWNVGHIAYYHCFFTYGRSGQELPLPGEYEELFKGGSSPSDWAEAPSVSSVVDVFKGLCDTFEADQAAGKFENYEGFEVFGGHRLETLTEALVFHSAHEGVHVGRIAAIKKLS